ncbi:MAG: SIS domain-containing protein [Promethearchaeota archaeon]
MNIFLKEIFSQPEALKETYHHAIKEQIESFREIRDLFCNNSFTKVIFTGMGSSLFSAFIPYYILNKNGINAEMREAGEFLLYSFPEKEPNYFNQSLIILISQSGESGEVIELLKKLKARKNRPILIGITNYKDSSLAKGVDIPLFLRAGEELSVTSKSYICSILILYILTQFILTGKLSNKDKLEIEDLIKKVADFLREKEKINIFFNNLVSFYGYDFNNIEILARGASLATAFQAALNFKEIVKDYSEANPLSTFRHGGIECLKKDSRLILISSDDINFKLNVSFIKKMIKDWNFGRILHISNRSFDIEDKLINTHPKIISFNHNILNPYLTPIMEIIILQLFFYTIAKKRGLNPGEFLYSEKITKEI